MQRYFVRFTPIRSGHRSQFFVVHAKSYLEAACLTAGQCDLDLENVDEHDYFAISRECIPLPDETPCDVVYLPLHYFMSVPWTRDNRRRA